MALMRYQPWSLLKEFHNEINQLFDKNLPLSVYEGEAVAAAQWSPNVNVEELDKEYIITADIPGVNPTDIKVALENNVLTIEGERKFEKRKAEKNFSRYECFQGKFYRSFTLPNTVSNSDITAKSKHGVLELHIPKRGETTIKKIQVKSEE